MSHVVEGAVFEAAWGRYSVHRITPGAGQYEVSLRDLSRAGAFVGSTIADLEAQTKYRFAGMLPAKREPRDPGVSHHPQAGGGPGARAPSVTRRTLGAVRPPAGVRGMVPGELGGGTHVSIPSVESLYWIACITPAEEPYYPEAEVIEGIEIHPRRRPIDQPHALHITSNLRPRLCCYGCQPGDVKVDPATSRLIRERTSPIRQALDHPYAPGAELPPVVAAPAPSSTPQVAVRPDAAALEREIEAWAATLEPDPPEQAPPAAAAPAPPPAIGTEVQDPVPIAAPPSRRPLTRPTLLLGKPGTMGDVAYTFDDAVTVTVINQAGVAIPGLTGWMARFGTADGRVYSAIGVTAWEAIAWAFDSWLRRRSGEPWNLAKPARLSDYPPANDGTYGEQPALKEA